MLITLALIAQHIASTPGLDIDCTAHIIKEWGIKNDPTTGTLTY